MMKFFGKKTFSVVGFVLSSLFTIQTAQAVEISVLPSVTNATTNNTITVEIVALNLTGVVGDSISAFDIDVAFDNSILGLTGITYGTGLDLGILGSFQSAFSTATSVEVTETSFEFGADLDTSQPDNFTLFTLEFITLAAGFTNLDLTVKSMTDSDDLLGPNTIIPSALNNGVVNVSNGGTVPEPGVLVLMAIGLASMRLVRRRK